jgi:hypothetical protein
MTATTKKRQWFLGGALIVTLGAVAWASQFENSDAEATVATVSHKTTRHEAEAPQQTTPQREQLARYSDSVKDIFALPISEQPPAQMPTEIIEPAAPPLPFTYMGRVVENGSEAIFLATAQQNYMARSGDVLESHYRIDSIDDVQVVFTYLPLKSVQTLEIGESQ